MFENIPAELKALPQWVNCKIVVRDGKPTKVPYNPNKIGSKAEVDSPATWGTFEQASANVTAKRAPMLGFVFTAADPYCGIDLDKLNSKPEWQARADRIIATADSYTERSPSGHGVHIIVRAALGKGRRRDGVEIYSQGRFFTFTGDTYHTPARAIIDGQALVETLASQMNVVTDGEYAYDEGEGVSKLTDLEVLDIALNAKNSDKFCRLFAGRWEGEDGWDSHSEADLALMSMFTFYTDNDPQCHRLFLLSALGEREKAVRPGYLSGLIKKYRSKQAPPVDIDALVAKAKTATPAMTTGGVLPVADRVANELEFPAGLVGEIAEYCYSSSNRPVREYALACGLALSAGVIGRAWNVSSTGLNLYLAVLGETGTGKEAMKVTIERLLHDVVNGTEGSAPVPAATQFMGPAMFASGPAFVRTLDEQPSFVSIIGEFGLVLQRWCADNAPAPVQQLRAALLDVFMKSGRTDTLRPSAYADKEKNTGSVRAPAVTICGESTPLRFYAALDNDGVSEGFVPRFSIIEYTGPRVVRNENAGHDPDPNLLQHLKDVMIQSMTLQQQGLAHDVDYTAAALDALNAFDLECDRQINEAQNPTVRELWTRAHLKALRIAALLAVSVNHLDPIIYPQDADWAIRFISQEIGAIARRFETGQVGINGEGHAEQALRKAYERFLTLDEAKARTYKVATKYVGTGCMPMPYLRCVLSCIAVFKNSRIGPTAAVRQFIEEQVKSGILARVDDKTCRERFGAVTDVYCPGEDWN